MLQVRDEVLDIQKYNENDIDIKYENKEEKGLVSSGKFLAINEKVKEVSYLGVKRAFDFTAAFLGIILLSPLFLIIALAIKLDSKGTVFYKHKRIGKNGKTIYLYKFRSMYSDSKQQLEKLLEDPKIRKKWEESYKIENDPRVTRVGKILRKLSIDELPQLINILIGNMSIIGPRPVIDGEIEKYKENKEKFLSVKPGLTGWWACNGRSRSNYDERILLELYYVDHKSISLDLKCFFKTIVSVLKKEGAM